MKRGLGSSGLTAMMASTVVPQRRAISLSEFPKPMVTLDPQFPDCARAGSAEKAARVTR